MTKFERDMAEALGGNSVEVISRRREALRKLDAEGRKCKNSFRRQCIAQEYVRLAAELQSIEELF